MTAWSEALRRSMSASERESDRALGAQVFALKGQVYAVYFPKATETGELDLSSGRGAFVRRWYNPREGVFEGEPAVVTGGGWMSIGSAPRQPEQDWAMLVQAKDAPESEAQSGAERAGSRRDCLPRRAMASKIGGGPRTGSGQAR